MCCGQVIPQSWSDIKHIAVVTLLTCSHAFSLTISPKHVIINCLVCQKVCRDKTLPASHVIHGLHLYNRCLFYRARTSTLCNRYYLSHNLCCSCHVVIAMQGAGVDEDDEREAMFEQARPTSARGPAPAPPRLLNPHPLQLKVVALIVCMYPTNACSHAMCVCVCVCVFRSVSAKCVEQFE